MFGKLIKKKHFRRKRARLKGARKLQNEGQPFFVNSIFSDMIEINLGLQQKDFPKLLVGTHAVICEVLIRQILSEQFYKICSSVMESIGNEKKLSLPLPSAWIRFFIAKGISCSLLYCRIRLLFLTLKQIAIGFLRSIYLIFSIKSIKSPSCPYVVFTDLDKDNLPLTNNQKSYDLISWYKESIIRKPAIGSIWAQTKTGKEYANTEGLIVSRSIFPKLDSFSKYLRYFFVNLHAFIISIFGVLMGKWWYGFLYKESVFLNYVRLLNNDQLADDYFFSNSNWFYKPLWAYETEKKGSTVSLFYYSTNIEIFHFKSNYLNERETYGLKSMLWNQIIVWDQQQEDYLKQYCPNATYIQVGSLDFTGIEYKSFSSNNKKILSVFDVTPCRPLLITKLGFAIPVYYTEKLNLKFLSTIFNVFNDDEWEILWKRKRIVSKIRNSNAFVEKQNNLLVGTITMVDTKIAPRSLIKISDAVISIPFTSTAIIGKELGKPSIYYDASERIEDQYSHGIPIIKSKDELTSWYKSLNIKNSSFHA